MIRMKDLQNEKLNVVYVTQPKVAFINPGLGYLKLILISSLQKCAADRNKSLYSLSFLVYMIIKIL